MSHRVRAEQGEWIAFTARAKEGDFWHVGASIASGLNGTSVDFRLLVNATNCSTVDTDGMNGLGDDGVDLLNGPLSLGYTGSWEAFDEVYKEEVFVPQGTHRVLFCADSGVFNLNYLRVWTPAPTPAPTMAPTIAPTPAPTVASDDDGGLGTRWIYIGVSPRGWPWPRWPGSGGMDGVGLCAPLGVFAWGFVRDVVGCTHG